MMIYSIYCLSVYVLLCIYVCQSFVLLSLYVEYVLCEKGQNKKFERIRHNYQIMSPGYRQNMYSTVWHLFTTTRMAH